MVEKKEEEIKKNPELEEEEEPFTLSLFSKWLSEKLKSGKKRMAEVE